jgi:tyrosyl-tRNA synthetase
MSDFLPVQQQLATLTRGAVDIHVATELEQLLTRSRETGTPLRVKAGFDPTRPDLHLGHGVLLEKLAQFQRLGHTAILLVGDFTAMVGDPTGASEARPRLTRDDVRAAAQTYTSQAFRILDAAATEIRHNSEWLDALAPSDILELMAQMTVSRMLERSDFSARFSDHRAIHMHEFLYPLLQGYDSVALRADIELGGTDQLFNLMVGRDIQPRYGQKGQCVLTVPLLEGTDARVEAGVIVGKKMSKSAGNYIGLQEAPAEVFRKAMQIDDKVIWRYFELLSKETSGAITAMKAECAAGGGDARPFKERFAREIISRFHSEADADAAARAFATTYSEGDVPADVAEFEVPTEGATLWIAKALSAAGLVKSTGEGKRMVEQGGVELDRAQVRDAQTQLQKGSRYLLRVGSKNRRFAYVRVTG